MDYSWITPVIAAIVAVIAFLQWHTARQKMVLDLFDKRFAVYEDLRLVVSRFLENGQFTPIQGQFTPAARATSRPGGMITFMQAQTRAKFLFGPELNKYLASLYSDLVQVDREARLRKRVPPGQEEAAQSVSVERLDRIGKFYAEIDTIVSPYMKHTQKALSAILLEATRRMVAKVKRKSIHS